ncbi:MAG: AAA-like domain-containing protein [Deltaproteobacteria bacterium]|jgi:hypothetical protein|nr:AAA-like domain-containing protein [Deltaproteobacteria bacterium]
MAGKPKKSFNTAGVCIPDKHYMIPALPRLPDVSDMIEGEFYFVLHAPRQSGKTTCLTALTEKINSEGRYYAVQCSLASLRNIEDDDKATAWVVSQINAGLSFSGVPELKKLEFSFAGKPYMSYPNVRVRYLLNALCEALDRDLVVFFDEADCLHAGPLITFLAQIRDGCLARTDKPGARFPRSLALVGMRDVGDYLYRVRPEDQSTGPASPFNVKKKSLTLSNFTLEQIKDLYSQHTSETGQPFEHSAFESAWRLTEGQPWLVNALAYDVIVERFENDYSKIVTGTDIDLAARSLILRNDTHFDSLAERLEEPRVRRVIVPVITGADSFPKGVSTDDIKYVVDLGLLKPDPSDEDLYMPANPIYQEIISRAMTRKIQAAIPKKFANMWMDDERIDMDGLLKAFQVYWRGNSEALKEDNAIDTLVSNSVKQALENYKQEKNFIEISDKISENIKHEITALANESFALLVLFAFLQRVMNGGADCIKREYALGKTRVDILVGYKGLSYPLELKIKGVQSREKSYEQLSGYMDKCGSPTGWLVVFDKDLKKTWAEKLFWETVELEGKTSHVAGC